MRIFDLFCGHSCVLVKIARSGANGLNLEGLARWPDLLGDATMHFRRPGGQRTESRGGGHLAGQMGGHSLPYI